MGSIDVREILKLPVEERLEIVDAIWNSIAASSDALPVTEAQKQELDRRLEEHRTNPGAVRSWEQVRDSLDE
jgi:putative addiction module component (TIGR02574 family)